MDEEESAHDDSMRQHDGGRRQIGWGIDEEALALAFHRPRPTPRPKPQNHFGPSVDLRVKVVVIFNRPDAEARLLPYVDRICDYCDLRRVSPGEHAHGVLYILKRSYHPAHDAVNTKDYIQMARRSYFSERVVVINICKVELHTMRTRKVLRAPTVTEPFAFSHLPSIQGPKIIRPLADAFFLGRGVTPESLEQCQVSIGYIKQAAKLLWKLPLMRLGNGY